MTMVLHVTPIGKIHKPHMSLSFHRVRESIATKIVDYNFIYGKHNPVDILSRHWAHNDIWPTLKHILFWPGDTMEYFENNNLK